MSNGSFDCSTLFMTHHNNEMDSQLPHCIFETCLFKISYHISCNSDDKKVTLALIKYHFRGNSRVGTSQNSCERKLPLSMTAAILRGGLNTLSLVVHIPPVTIQYSKKSFLLGQPLTWKA